MQLRQTKQRRSSASTGGGASALAPVVQQLPASEVNNHVDLPPEIMAILASRLSLPDVASAAQTCIQWCLSMRRGITRATLGVGSWRADDATPLATPPNAPGPSYYARTLQSLGAHSSVRELQLLLNSRSTPMSVLDTLGQLSKLPKLRQLRLVFLQSNTPRMGGWCAGLDKVDAAGLEQLTVEGPAMPSHILAALLKKLSKAWVGGRSKSSSAPKSSSASRNNNKNNKPGRRQLDLMLGEQTPGSQLQGFSSPVWLLDRMHILRSGPTGDMLTDYIAKMDSLVSLRMQIDSIAVKAEQFASLSQLTNMTELVLHGASSLRGTLGTALVRELPKLKSLRKLKFGLRSLPPWDSDDYSLLPDLDHIQELDIEVMCDPVGAAVRSLVSRPPPGLRGLSLRSLMMDSGLIEQLAGLTNLTSLQLKGSTKAGAHNLDLIPLRQLTGLKQLALEVSQPIDLMLLKFSPPPKPERVLTGACQSVGKRRCSISSQAANEDSTKWGDISAITTAWPHLQDLRLSGLPAYCVSHTSWEGLSKLTSLTSLTLQFQPASAQLLLISSGCKGLKQPASLPGGALPVLRLEHLPATIQQLQLTNCFVGVPATGCLRSGEALTSLSLSHCHLGSIQKGTSSRQGYPIIVDAGTTSTSSSSAAQQQHPLLLLLQHTSQLQQLELIGLVWLSDSLLMQVAATTQLRSLSSLSVVGVGNTYLTHGALLGLTSLKSLRDLRWHVGDVLSLMPDVRALAELKGLMRLSLPHWLHAQMERWGAYAVLRSMPLCDVNVELA